MLLLIQIELPISQSPFSSLLICVHMWKPGVDAQCLPLLLSTLSLETGSHWIWGLPFQLDCWPTYPPAHSIRHWGDTDGATVPTFYVDIEDPNSGPCACLVGTVSPDSKTWSLDCQDSWAGKGTCPQNVKLLDCRQDRMKCYILHLTHIHNTVT